MPRISGYTSPISWKNSYGIFTGWLTLCWEVSNWRESNAKINFACRSAWCRDNSYSLSVASLSKLGRILGRRVWRNSSPIFKYFLYIIMDRKGSSYHTIVIRRGYNSPVIFWLNNVDLPLNYYVAVSSGKYDPPSTNPMMFQPWTLRWVYSSPWTEGNL
jgi:hypothetical protein